MILIIWDNLNLFFNSNLEASSGSPTLKKKSTPKILQLAEKQNLVDSWKIRNLISNRFTFRQKNISLNLCKEGLITFLFHIVCENLSRKNILPSFWSNQLPILFIYKSDLSFNLEKNFQKFNSS